MRGKLAAAYFAGAFSGAVSMVAYASWRLMSDMKLIGNIKNTFNTNLTQDPEQGPTKTSKVPSRCNLCEGSLTAPDKGAPYCERCDRK